MPVEAIKIPQNVQIEDRVVGPLTLRQIIIIAVGGGFSYMLYAMVQRSMGHIDMPLTIALWTPAAIAALFALVKINDLSLTRICLLMIEKTQKPSHRVWAPRSGISIVIRTSANLKKDEDAKKKKNVEERTPQQQIAELTGIIDRNAPAAEMDASGPNVIDANQFSSQRPASPVNPGLISANSPASSLEALSDLSVFRDVLPPTSTWPS